MRKEKKHCYIDRGLFIKRETCEIDKWVKALGTKAAQYKERPSSENCPLPPHSCHGTSELVCVCVCVCTHACTYACTPHMWRSEQNSIALVLSSSYRFHGLDSGCVLHTKPFHPLRLLACYEEVHCRRETTEEGQGDLYICLFALTCSSHYHTLGWR